MAFEYDGESSRSSGVTVRSSTISWVPARTHDRGCVRIMGGEMFQVCTNHYRQRGAAISCDRYKEIDRRLDSLKSANKWLDVNEVWEILRSVSRPTKNIPRLMTYHSVVFEPNAMRMHVAFTEDGKPAPSCTRVTVDVKTLLYRSEL
ncbi:MAG: hypothetical protein ACE5EQ_10100 [Phycisphaerae bacterium]